MKPQTARRELRLLAVYSGLEDEWKLLPLLAAFFKTEFRIGFQCRCCLSPLVQAWTGGGPVGPMLPAMPPRWTVIGF